MKNIQHKSVLMYPLLFLIITMSSCTKTWITNESDKNYEDLFLEMWNDIHDNYAFFDQKEVDWLNVKNETSELFLDGVTDEEAFNIYSSALKNLQDGHVSLYSSFNAWNFYDLFLPYAENYNEGVIRRNYLNNINTIGPFTYDILENEIGYLRYASFGSDFEDEQLKYLLEYFKNTKGLIIDIRGNLGGAADNVNALLPIFIDEDILVGKVFTKKDGACQEKDYIIKKNKEFETYQGKVSILTNRQCYSSCNVFAGFASQLPNVTIVGDQTGGGSGIAVAHELANGWQYRFSAGKITLLNGVEMENGVVPDFQATTTDLDAAAGRDAILDMAIEKLK